MKGKPITNANELTSYAVKVFRKAGFVAWRQNNGAVWDEARQSYRTLPDRLKGVADVMGFRLSDGKILACEVKAGKDRLSADQANFLNAVSKSGGVAVVCRHARDLEPWMTNPQHIPSYPVCS